MLFGGNIFKCCLLSIFELWESAVMFCSKTNYFLVNFTRIALMGKILGSLDLYRPTIIGRPTI